jgi:hypothetical protein
MRSITNKLRQCLLSATGAALLLAAAGPAAAAGVLHSVHVGSPDLCTFGGAQPGCDGNWSVTALKFDDGTVRGEFIDRWTEGVGVKGKVNCLIVDGNRAWMSGTGYFYDNGRVTEGAFAISAKDNGVSVGDTPDLISTTLIGPAELVPDCTQFHSWFKQGFDHPYMHVHLLPQGQVKIK